MPTPDPSAAPLSETIAATCPYLLAEDGGWRAAQPMREHRCHAVRPPATLTTEQQRRLCLVAAHAECLTYQHACEAERTALRDAGVDPDRVAARRTVALTRPIPIALERPTALPGPTVLTGRARRLAEVALVAMMLLAAALLVLARFGGLGLIGAP
ncbi:MAG: hypothetical protein ACXWN5_08940 [Candidatus Limnocylindrales bacterium]